MRGIGYHESVAESWTGTAYRLVADRPVRLQHRGGALWMLNTRALIELGLLATRDDGRLWRDDTLLRERLGEQPPPTWPRPGGAASLGITGVTDATPRAVPLNAVRLLTAPPCRSDCTCSGRRAAAGFAPG